MKGYDKEIQQVYLNNEKAVLNALKETYEDALAEIYSKLEALMARQDKDMQHVIYQIDYQKALKAQVQAILTTLQTNEFETVSEYLAKSYEDGYLGAMYSLQQQGIPFLMPIDQEAVAEAVQQETKLNEDLYTALGKDMKVLQKQISGEISRGISTGMVYGDIARNIANWAKIPKNNAMRIARTEMHRIQNKATMDLCAKAKSKGADIVRQWDSTLDSRTRRSHRKLDGQIRELDEPFEVNGHKAMFPGDFGRPEEDINCRCRLLQRARALLDDDIVKNAEYEDGTKVVQVKAKDYQEFKDEYFRKIDEAKASQHVRSSAQKMNDMDQSDVIKGMMKKAVKKAVNKANEHSPLPLSKLSGKYKDDIQKICDQSPDNIKKLYGKYENRVHFINEKQLGSSVTSKKGISVNFKNDSTDKRGAWTSTFHEIGHRIEREAGDVIEKYPVFKNSLVADFDNIVNSYQKMYNVSKQEAYESIGKALKEPKFHSISDLVGGLTNNECVGGHGHKTEYWAVPYKLEREAFAHFYEATARNDTEKLDAIKAMFPSAYAEFERMVDEI